MDFDTLVSSVRRKPLNLGGYDLIEPEKSRSEWNDPAVFDAKAAKEKARFGRNYQQDVLLDGVADSPVDRTFAVGREAMRENLWQEREEGMSRSLRDVTPIIREPFVGAGQAGARLGGLALKPFAPEASDYLSRFGQAQERAADQAATGDWFPGAGRVLRGSVESLLEAGALSPAGPFGMAAGFGLMEADEAYKEAIESGVPEETAGRYAMNRGLNEALISSIFTGAGKVAKLPWLAGLEGQAFTREVAKRTLKQHGIDFAKSLGGEIPEELITELGHNLLRAKIDPSADDWDNQIDTAVSTIAQTIVTMGLAEGMSAASSGLSRRGGEKPESVPAEEPLLTGVGSPGADEPSPEVEPQPPSEFEERLRRFAESPSRIKSSEFANQLYEMLPDRIPVIGSDGKKVLLKEKLDLTSKRHRQVVADFVRGELGIESPAQVADSSSDEDAANWAMSLSDEALKVYAAREETSPELRTLIESEIQRRGQQPGTVVNPGTIRAEADDPTVQAAEQVPAAITTQNTEAKAPSPFGPKGPGVNSPAAQEMYGEMPGYGKPVPLKSDVRPPAEAAAGVTDVLPPAEKGNRHEEAEKGRQGDEGLLTPGVASTPQIETGSPGEAVASPGDFQPVSNEQLAAVSQSVGNRVFSGQRDVEDLTQDLFVKLANNRDKFDPTRGVPFEAWATSVAKRMLVDHLRKSGRESTPGDEVLSSVPDTSQAGDVEPVFEKGIRVSAKTPAGQVIDGTVLGYTDDGRVRVKLDGSKLPRVFDRDAVSVKGNEPSSAGASAPATAVTDEQASKDLAREQEIGSLRKNQASNPSVGDLVSRLENEARSLGLKFSTQTAETGSRYFSAGVPLNEHGDWNDQVKIRVSNHGGRGSGSLRDIQLTTLQSPEELQSNIEKAVARLREISPKTAPESGTKESVPAQEGLSGEEQPPKRQGAPGETENRPTDLKSEKEVENVTKAEAQVSSPEEGTGDVPTAESVGQAGRGEGVAGVAVEPVTNRTPEETVHRSLSARVADRLGRGEKIDPKSFWQDADDSFGGTRAEGKYGPSEAYDELESGVNQHLRSRSGELSPTGDLTDAIAKVKRLEEVESRIPRQQNRSGNKDVFQQFSTPPAYAFATSWVANIQPDDVVLEPSAGTGSLAVHAQNAGAEVHVNELDPKRRELLANLSPTGVTGEDAEQIGNILAGKLSPSVVVMNPPFSHAGHRMGSKTIVGTDLKHIDAALSLVKPGGRVVAIVGAGLHGETKAIQNWVRETGKKYAVRANVVVGRDVYKTSGTDFPTRVLVVDKVAPVSGQEVIRGSAANLEEFLQMMEGVRNERGRNEPSSPSEQAAVLPSVPEPAGESGAETGFDQRGDSVPAATGVVGGGESPTGDSVPAVEEPHRDGVPSVRDDGRRTGASSEASARPTRGTVNAGEGVRGEEVSGGRSIEGGPGDGGERVGVVGGSSAEPGERLSAEKVERSRVERREANVDDEEGETQEAVFESYQPSVSLPGAKTHPASIVESTAMAAVRSPDATGVKLALPAKVVRDGLLSEVQLEAVTYARMSHEQFLPTGERQGYMVGDGTGVGKGREISGIILDNFMEGRKRSVWVSKNWKLFKDARRDWGGLGQNPEMIHRHDKYSPSDSLDIKEGALFTTYGTLKSAQKKENGATRVEQLVKWLGEDFDGVIGFDESHAMANGIDMGNKEASEIARAGIALQEKLPKARVVYVSATGATNVENLAYAVRLGLWGDGTPFASVLEFVNKIGSGGVAAMEVVARDMKALGKYLARSISFNDGTKEGTVQYERLEHKLSDDQVAMYDRLGDAWRSVYDRVLEALGKTSANSRAKSRAMSAFWSSQQRFYSQILVALQAPSVIQSIEKDLADGRSAVIQLVNTGEAAQERALAGRKEDDDLEDLDLSPRDILMRYVENSFPVAEYEEYMDDNGNVKTRPVVDSHGNPVQNSEAVAMRDQLLDELGSISIGSESPIDMVIGHFGVESVAEITGRKQRVVSVRQPDGSFKRTRQQRTEKTREAEAVDFQSGKRRVLIFSDAGGTGSSYHADRSAKNQQPRRHYLLQAGWRADAAIQGFGRTHRSNQVQAPTYILVTTDIKGQKRFISTIARRLSQLGALTKGQSGAGSTGVFRATDNLESRQARDALRRLFRLIYDGKSVAMPGGAAQLQRMTGLKIATDDGRMLDTLPGIEQFLNRLLSLPIEMQNGVFDEFDSLHQQEVERAEREGTADKGVEVLRADRIEKETDKVVRVDPGSGAETRYVRLKVGNRTKPKTWEQVQGPRVTGFVESVSGHVYAVEGTGQSRMDTKTGSVDTLVRLVGVTDSRLIEERKLGNAQYWSDLSKSTARDRWVKAVEKAPEFHEQELHMVTGLLLPIWDRFTGEGATVKSVTTDAGERLLGRVIHHDQLDATLKNLGVDAAHEARSYSLDEVMLGIESGQTAGLANGWKVKESRVGGETRVELIGPSFTNNNELHRLGVFWERVQSKTRYFVPTNRAKSVLGEVIKNRPVVSMSKASSGVVGMPMSSGMNPVSGRRVKMGIPMRKTAPAGVVVPQTKAAEVIEAVGDAVKELGAEIPVRTGLYKQKFRGIFKPDAWVARVRVAGDVVAATHELGHGMWAVLDAYNPKALSPVRSLKLRGELMGIGKALYPAGTPAGGYVQEGFADFVRQWVTDPKEAKVHAPKMVDWWEKTFLPTMPDFKAKMEAAQQKAKDFREQGHKSEAKSQLVDMGSRERRVEGLKRTAKGFFGNTSLWETLDPYRHVKNEAERLLGRKLNITEDPYRTAKTLRMTQHGIVRKFVEDGIRDLTGGYLAPALNDLGASIPEDEALDFKLYLFGKRALALWQDPNGPRNPGISEQVAQWLVDDVENDPHRAARFATAADVVYKWNEGVLDYVSQFSPVFAQAVDKIRARDPGYYVPLARDFEAIAGVIRQSSGSASRGNLMAKLRGSGLPVKDMIPQMISNATRMVSLGHQRMVLEQLANLANVDGIGNIIEEVGVNEVPVAARTIEDLVAEIEKRLAPGEELSKEWEDVAGEVVTFFAQAQQTPKGKPVIPLYVDDGAGGKSLKWYYVNEELYAGLSGMDFGKITENANGMLIWRAMTLPTRVAKAGWVGLRANFGFWNMLADLPTFMVNSRANANPFATFATWAEMVGKSFMHVVTGSTSPEIEFWERMGGPMASSLGEDQAQTRTYAQDVFGHTLKERIFSPSKWGTVVKDFVEFYRDLIQFAENAPRLAEIKLLAAERGIDLSKPVPTDEAFELLLAGQEVTIDFREGGSLTRIANQLIPFLMVPYSGARATARAIQDHPVRFFTRAGMMGLAALLLWWKNKDEEWYKNKEDDEKQRYYFVRVGDTILKLPRRDIGLFTGITETLADAAYRKEPEAMTAWMNAFVKSFMPSMPPIFEEPLEQAADKDFFTGMPIVGKKFEGKPADEQYDEYTSRAAILVGEVTGLSPKRVDHVIRGFFGGVGTDLVEAVGVGPKGVDRDWEASDFPIFGRLFQRGGMMPSQPKAIREFYDTMSSLQTRERSEKNPLTGMESQQLVMLEDARKALTVLSAARRVAKNGDERDKAAREMVKIAEDVLGHVKSGKLSDKRKSALVYSATSGLDNVKDSTRESRLETRDALKSSGLSKEEQLKALDAHWLAEAQEAENKKAAKQHRKPRKVTTFNRTKAYLDRRRLIQQGM